MDTNILWRRFQRIVQIHVVWFRRVWDTRVNLTSVFDTHYYLRKKPARTVVFISSQRLCGVGAFLGASDNDAAAEM